MQADENMNQQKRANSKQNEKEQIPIVRQIHKEQEEFQKNVRKKLFDKKWQYRDQEIDNLISLLESHSNISLNGFNGCGKTTFVLDCLKYVRYSSPYIYVDTVEYFNEKLISIYMSQQLHGILQNIASQLRLSKMLKKKFYFKTCTNFSAFLELVQALQTLLQSIKKQQSQDYPQLQHFNLHFYVVFDNIKNILKIERQKKTFEKLCIVQSLLSQRIFSILTINDSIADEFYTFRDQTNFFDEYMFQNFYFNPMKKEQLKEIIFNKMVVAYADACPFLLFVFENYFQSLMNYFQQFTCNINEFLYIFKFLYPSYVKPLYLERKNLSVEQILENDQKKIGLFSKKFQLEMQQMQNSLYMHMSSQEDIDIEIEKKQDQELIERIKKGIMSQNMIESSRQYSDGYKYDEIEFIKDFKQNVNFSYMQSIILIAAFLAGSNKESSDLKLYETQQQKKREGRNGGNTNNQKGQLLVGKTRRFTIDRLVAIAQFLCHLEIENSLECQNVNQSFDFYSCINTLASEDLLKKSTFKSVGAQTSGNSDELVNISFKCNFDKAFVQDIADKINFQLNEYLFTNEKDD